MKMIDINVIVINTFGRNHLVSQLADKLTFYIVKQSSHINYELCFIK